MNLALFADADPSSQALAAGGWVGVLVAGVLTVLNAVIGARAAKAKLDLDVEKVKLQARVDVLEATTARGEADCQARLAVVQQQLITLRLELEVERGKTLRLEERLAHETSRRRQTAANLNNRMDLLDPSKSQSSATLDETTPAG